MISRLMTSVILGVSAGLAAADPTFALVGKTDSPGLAASHTVMVLKRQSSRAAFCSGVVVADRTILTAAHCVTGATGVAINVPGGGAPKLQAARSVAVHPGYVPNAIARRKRSIDLALVLTAEPLPPVLRPVAIAYDYGIQQGTRLRIAGYGLQREGVERGAGTLRSALLVVRAPLSSILIWMRGPSKAIAGACTGDSGGPVFSPDATALVAISVWARGKGRRNCGELTQAIRLGPQRAWIDSVLARWRAR
jgi:hypothetical protein